MAFSTARGTRQALGWITLAAAVALAPPALPAQDIVVDESDGAPAYTETGTWSATSNVGAGYNGGIYRFTRSTNPPSTATWTPTFPAPGAYQVFAVFRAGADRSARAPYSVVHAGGTTNLELDQTGVFSGDLAVESLGAYQFAAGTGGTVTLSNSVGSGVYIADAIIFSPDTPPVIGNVGWAPLYPTAADAVRASASVTDNTSVQSVELQWSVPAEALSGNVPALDNGTGGDATAGDGVYTATIPAQADGATVEFSLVATDSLGTQATDGPNQYVVGATGTWQLLINEAMASNSGTFADPDFGESGDWVEIYNAGPDTADLHGLTLTDLASTPLKWAFPVGALLPANQYMVVWCDDHNSAGLAYHTNFKLSAEGESVILYDTKTSSIVDQVAWTSLVTGESTARIPNLTGPFTKTITPTPGAANLLGVRGAAPLFSVPSGYYTNPVAVTITAPGATEIRYTLDGSWPEVTSTLYLGTPVPISTTTGLRARAYYSAADPSEATSASYFFTAVPDRTIPIINIVADPKDLFDPVVGIYPNYDERGDAWEKEAHVSIFSPDGTVTENFDAGLRIHGGFSRSAAKRSFRLYLRNIYGADSVTLPWMQRTPATAIKQVVLRAGGNDGFLVTTASQLQQVTYVRDQIMRDWYHEQGNYAADGFFAALYLNGQYWGLYNATERITNDQMSEVLGGDSDYDIVKGTWTFETKFYTEATDGDLVAWDQFLAWQAANDVATAPGLAALKDRIDYRNFLGFFALNIFCQNEDWPHNNWIASRHRTLPGAKWVFHEWDSEWGLGLRPQGWTSDTMQWAMGNNYQLSPSHNGKIAPLSNLFNGNDLDASRTSDINGILDNPAGKRDFLNSVEDLLNFQVVPAKATAQFDVYVDQIRTEIPRESARWASSTAQTAATLNGYWDNAVINLRNFLANRPAFIRNLLATKLAVTGSRTIRFEAAGTGTGRLQLRGHLVDLPWEGTFFDGSTLELSAIATPGSEFSSWSGLISASTADTEHLVASGAQATVTITFGEAVPEYLPNDVIFNEYWVNDGATTYATIGGVAIDRDWFELLVVKNGVDLRGWRVTSNPTIATTGAVDSGSIILPNLPVLSNVPAGTIILIVSSSNATNDASFPTDDLDLTDQRLILYVGNGNLDAATDPNFGIGTGDDPLILLTPGASASFADDIGIDFIAEGTRVTPSSFFQVVTPPVSWPTPFSGIGGDDGAVFINSSGAGLINDDGTDPTSGDFTAGPGGWVVDPESDFTGDSVPVVENRLTPGAANWGQNLNVPLGLDAWIFE
jgi:hypothetical protein